VTNCIQKLLAIQETGRDFNPKKKSNTTDRNVFLILFFHQPTKYWYCLFDTLLFIFTRIYHNI